MVHGMLFAKIALIVMVAVTVTSCASVSGASKQEKESMLDTLGGASIEASKKDAYKAQAAFKTIVPTEFASGSSAISPEMEHFFSDIAIAYKSNGVRKVLIVGHTDSLGGATFNQLLSEARAKAVANIFVKEGYPATDIYYQGAGETAPIKDNASEEGRASNRRVEIIDADTTQNLAMAKRASITEVKSKAMKQPTHQSLLNKNVAVKDVKSLIAEANAKYHGGLGSKLPFHGELYTGQQLMASGYKAKVVEKPAGLLGGVSSAIAKVAVSMVSSAHASVEQGIPLFIEDDLPTSGTMKRVDGNDQDLFFPNDYLLGYYKQPLYTYLDGNAFISLQPVSVLKEEAITAVSPSLIVYNKFDGKGDKADAKIEGLARLYVSGDNMLYRWKSKVEAIKSSGILGMDILLPKYKKSSFANTHIEHLTAQVYYMKGGKIRVAKIFLDLKLNKISEINWRL